MKDIRLICFFILLVFTHKAQLDSSMLKNSSPATLKKLGKSAMKQNDPGSAITFLEAYLQSTRSDAKAMNLLAEAYMSIRDYERAQRMFLQAYNTNREKVPEALYYHAVMQKSNARYDSARINFQKFKKEYKGSEKKLKKQATKEIAYCDSVVRIVGTEYKIVIQRLGNDINKVNAEGAPFNLDDNQLVFTSLRTEKKEYIIEDDTARPVRKKLYYAKRVGNDWKYMGEYGQDLNDAGYNTANACFSPDRKRIYFTRCKLNYMKKMICAIYVSEKDGDKWTEPVKLPKNINNPKYTSTMPAVTTDPVKGNDIIYFVTDKKGGKGGRDIWYTIYDKKNKLYKAPRNAGTKVNTSLDEITPFFDNETRTLYFSSNGLGGLGGFDIFRTRGDGKKFTGTENIGQPINTGTDDLFYTISTNRGEGFFVSNRKGGNALKNSTCCDDIYYYKHAEYIRIILTGNVTVAPDKKIQVAGATIEIYIKDKKTQERFVVKTMKTDSLGNYKTQLEAGQDYAIVVKKDDFLGGSAELSTKGITGTIDLVQDLQLSKKPKEPMHIPEILYEFNAPVLVEKSKLILDTTVFRLMEDNPELVIEIQSHTDSKGSELFNMKLSQKRADGLVKYLISKGITPERLKGKGYGESKPIAPNDNPDGTDNPEGRAKNRRTDFKIIGTIDPSIINDGKFD